MKIIGAGLPRTATLTLKIAIEMLGAGPCYHMANILTDTSLVPQWTDAFDGQACSLLFSPAAPALARDLAAAAARSPHSEWCVTVVDRDGIAIGHGCAKPARTKRATSPPVNNRDGPWTFTPRDDPGPPDGYATWTLTLPGGRELTVKLGPVPVTECDHRYESHSYQPSDTLRHLVEIRDGTCTFPFWPSGRTYTQGPMRYPA